MIFRYGTIEPDELIEEFNSRLSRFPWWSEFNSKTLEQKLNIVTEKVESILEMYPNRLYFKISLHKEASEVRALYKDRFEMKLESHSFCDREKATIYLTISKATIDVLAHEIAHIVVNQSNFLSVKIHELISQYVEGKI